MKDASSASKGIAKLGTMIKNIMEFVNARHNGHHAIKDQGRAITAGYLEAREGLKESNRGKKQGETAALQSTSRVLPTTMDAVAQGILGTKLLGDARMNLKEVLHLKGYRYGRYFGI